MASRHIDNFLAKSWSERYRTARFYVRRGLSRIPYLPVPVRLKISDRATIEFWWSHLAPYFDENRGFLDYWGNDVADLCLVWRLLQPGMVFMDVGANQGIYSLVAGKKLQNDGTVIAFEPSPREYQRLRMHFRWNGLSRGCAEMLALGNMTKRTSFFQVASGDTTRNGLRAPTSGDPVVEIPIETITLDEYVASRGMRRLDLIKIDVEGGELDVLRGAATTLERLRPIFLCEVLDAATRPWEYPAREIIAALQNQKYDWFDVNDDGSIAPHQIRAEYPDVKNYLAVPNEKRGMVEGGGPK